MANPGVGTKFVSVNLNKSYGQQPQHHHNHSAHSSSYGSIRTRPGSHGGGGGGGGMVVLSRPRSSQKAGPKLSVPPPLNLPSLRKEHERFDSLGSGSVHAGGGISGSGSRPASSGVGWTKPAPVALQEKEGFSGDHVNDGGEPGSHGVDGVSKGNSGLYMPPSARLGAVGPSASSSEGTFLPVEKSTVLRGEDFPSLQATLPASSGPAQKQKEGFNQKQRQLTGEDLSNEQRDGSLNSLVDIRPQLQSGRSSLGSGFSESGGETRGMDGSRMSEQGRKQEEYLPGPLPLVRLNPRSDWADDERDTGHGLMDRGRNHGYSKNEASWDRDFDLPRASFLPHKPAHNLFDRWGQRDNDTGKVSSSEVSKADPYSRDVRTLSDVQEGNSWRASSPLSKDGFSSQEVGNDRNSIGARPSSTSRETSKEINYIPSSLRDNIQEDVGRRDVPNGQGGRQPWNHKMDSFSSRGAERNPRERYGSEQHHRYRGDAFQNSFMSKSSMSSGTKGLPVADSMLNFGREKRPFSKSEKPYFEDPFMKDFGASGFDARDPFPGSFVGVVKKKKEVLKPTDFHDPVRESFEAELERVQKLQEQERQRIIEEQERALELARREEEERLRLAREQEERQRRLEEEAREAAWRAEQERLEAMRRAEEIRIAREEEKRRIVMEEERRKQAAKQKLLELEERIAKRQAEAAKSGSSSSAVADENVSGMIRERDILKLADVGEWEDGERMVERITTSASSDSSVLNGPFEMGSRPHFSRDGSLALMDRGKPIGTWRRDAIENVNNSAFIAQDMESGHHSPQREASIEGKAFPKKEFYGAAGFMSSRAYYKGGIPEHMDETSHPKGQRWNISGDGDHYGRNTEMESEYHENLGERYGNVGWGQGEGRSRANPYSPYAERTYQNSDGDGYYSFGRARYSVRQPRVLPPPSLASMQKASYKSETEHPGSSSFLETEMQYKRSARNETVIQTHDDGQQGNLGQPQIVDMQDNNTENAEQKLDRNPTPRCDSQSSLSVSSPPNSPIHLSHDDLDESGDSPIPSATGQGQNVALSGQGNEPGVLPTEAGKEDTMAASGSVSSGDDEEWAIENNGQLQEQEEYDEDEDGYQEEDEVHDGDEENVDLTEEFEEMHLEDKGSSPLVDNLVLGFNEGVEVRIPSDEFERSSRNDEPTFAMQQLSVGTIEGQGSLNGINGDGQTLQPVDVPCQVNVDSSSRIFQEAGNAMQDMSIKPNAPQTSTASELVDHVDASISCGASTRHQVPPFNIASNSSSGQNVMSTASAVPSQAEMPVKLQFGLFSGPSLIPSPIPAIQIGSIQMPLHLHRQVGPSLTHMHRPQPPIFQFGQLRYTSPISQGVLPLPPQSMSFVHSNVPSNFSLSQNPGVPLPVQPVQETSANNLIKNDALSLLDNQAGIIPRALDLPHVNVSKEVSPLPRGNTETVVEQIQAEISHINDKFIRSGSGVEAEGEVQQELVRKFKSLSTRELETQVHAGTESSQLASKGKDMSGSKSQGQVYGVRGKRYVFTVKNSSTRSSNLDPDGSRADSNGYQRRPRRQRTEFRIRENHEKRQLSGMVSSNHTALDDKLNVSGRGAATSIRNGTRKVGVSNKSSKQNVESECLGSGPVGLQEMNSGSQYEKGAGKESFTKSQNISNSGEGNLKRNLRSEEDVDAPLQSGIVQVFEQPGIEAPSDEDDFIEVRSKRQMLIDRREQREKEIKAKSRSSKVPRRPRSTLQNSAISASSNKISASMGGEAANARSDFVTPERRNLGNIEVSAGFNASIVSQPLAPIGTPAVKADAKADTRSQTIKSLQTSSIPGVSCVGKDLASSFIFESKNKVLDNVQTSLGSWGNPRINQQVMALTQTQLDEAMKPVQFDSCASVGDHSSSVSEPSIPSSSILAKDKSFSSAASPVNSLLAGEKIQFGAVTSPTILPPSSRAVSHGIGPPGPCRPDLQISRNLSAAENDCSLFFEKDKHSNESCVPLEDCEAEAEAAASAVAVAAITSDEIGGNGLGAHSVSVADTNSFGGADLDGMAAGVAGEQASQSRAEESLSVALPADLSVETPISLWPPLPSPQKSSQMISHFPGGPPSHFPFYEMNPMLGGPIFAFGPHDESASTQSQSQKSSAAVSGPLGTWQQCHSGVDSFYGPPAGFTGPFISPPGGIPGVQGPPHMVVYNHFAPVGQYGQVGLSFMGTAYIPSGKQPDWKHDPVSAAMGGGEGDATKLNMASSQRNATNMAAPVQHLASRSPLLPMASPLAMFDVSPFQSSPDITVQARWSQVPASPLQSVPLSMPLQQQAEGVLSSQFNHASPVDQSLTAGRFAETRTSTSSDSSRNFPAVTDATVTQLPDELGLVDPSSSMAAGAATQSVVTKSSSVGTIGGAGKTDVGKNSNGTGQNASSNLKSQSSQQKNISNQQYGNLSGYNHQRGGGVSQKSNSGIEWSHRRSFQGRNQPIGGEKNFPGTKMKQIYVAKQTSTGTSTTS